MIIFVNIVQANKYSSDAKDIITLEYIGLWAKITQIGHRPTATGISNIINNISSIFRLLLSFVYFF